MYITKLDLFYYKVNRKDGRRMKRKGCDMKQGPLFHPVIKSNLSDPITSGHL